MLKAVWQTSSLINIYWRAVSFDSHTGSRAFLYKSVWQISLLVCIILRCLFGIIILLVTIYLQISDYEYSISKFVFLQLQRRNSLFFHFLIWNPAYFLLFFVKYSQNPVAKKRGIVKQNPFSYPTSGMQKILPFCARKCCKMPDINFSLNLLMIIQGQGSLTSHRKY